jgi:adenylate kinase
MRLVLFGLAGAGKGTQAKLLSERLGVPHVASGDLFRHHQSQGTELGLLAKEYMERGELVPDDVTIQMLLERLGRDDASKGFILDGFPRTLEQAKALDDALGSDGVDLALCVGVSEDELVRRLSSRVNCRDCGTPFSKDDLPSDDRRCPDCGGELHQRADDEPEVVRKRLQIQRPGLEELTGHYAQANKLVEIDGERTSEEVHQEAMRTLDSWAGSATNKVAD